MSGTRLKPVDIVVIGAGVAGTIVGKELAETGLSVVGFERGRMLDPQYDFAMPYVHDELKYGRHSDVLQNLSRETITFRNSMNETALPMREIGPFKIGECVGGAGVHWTASAQRFLPWDFETRSRTLARYGRKMMPEDCTSQDWGITYDELEPYYDQFEHLYGVGGKAGNLNGEIQPGGNPFEGPRSREFPNPPTQPTYCDSLFAQAAASLGYQPFQKPAAAMTRPYTNPYRLTLGQCQYGGFCAGYVCASGAKASPLTTVLPALLRHPNFELRTNANVIRINLDSDGKRAIGVTYIDARGNELQQPADLVILTSYVFNNTRLLLLSGIGRPYDPVANQGVVGRNYSYQTIGKVELFFEDKAFNTFMGGGAIGTVTDEFNGDNFDHAGLGFIGGAYLTAHSVLGPIRSHPAPHGTPRWGSRWKQAVAHYYNRSFAIGSHGASQSYRSNYLDLDPTYRDAHGLPLLRMTFDYQDNDRRMSAYITDQAAPIAKALGPSHISVHPVGNGKFSIGQNGNTHNIGGVAMGADPATSAVNKYLQSWDVPNVFVIGASAFPQNSANSPTCTVGALACWAADAIKSSYLKQPGPLV